MRSLLIFSNSPVLGGAETLSIRLASALNKRGARVTLAMPPASPVAALARNSGIPTLDLKIGAKISSRNFLQALFSAPFDYFTLYHFLKQHVASQNQAVVLFQFKKEQFLGTLAAHRLGIRVLWIEHGPLPKLMTRWPWIMLYRMAARKATKIIVVSSAVQRSLVSHGLSQKQIQVIHPAVPDSFFELPEAASDSSMSAPAGVQTIGTVSRLLRNKGIDDFIRAAVLISQRFPLAQFLIVGDGADRPWLEQLARDHPSTPITFAGAQSQVAPWLRRMDVVVNSTVAEGEGMPLRILEAIACARPVVSTDVGGCAEALDQGRYGRLVPPRRPDLLAEAVTELLEDADTAAKLGKEAQSWCRKTFDQEVSTSQWMDILSDTSSS